MSLFAGLEATGAGVLIVVFIIAGTAKIRSPLGAALAMARFGLLREVNPWAGRAAGAVELGTAAGILLWPNQVLPLLETSGLLFFFVILLAIALVRGNRFPCACFGTHGSPLSIMTLLRTLLLLIISVGCLLTVMLGLSVSAPDTRVLGLCIGAVIVCIVGLLQETWVSAPFARRFGVSG
jgi:hypothetical protein